MQIQKITPCLWFDDQAEDAVAFYAGIFPNSKIVNIAATEKRDMSSIVNPRER